MTAIKSIIFGGYVNSNVGNYYMRPKRKMPYDQLAYMHQR